MQLILKKIPAKFEPNKDNEDTNDYQMTDKDQKNNNSVKRFGLIIKRKKQCYNNIERQDCWNITQTAVY